MQEPGDGLHRAELRGIRSDIGQLTSLMNDATSRLMSSFDAMNVVFGRQRRLLIDAGLLQESRRDGSSDIHSSKLDPERAVSQVVTALQFHDIGLQILVGIGSRLDALDEMTARSLHHHASSAAEVAGSIGQPAAPPAVTQTTMTVGTIELF